VNLRAFEIITLTPSSRHGRRTTKHARTSQQSQQPTVETASGRDELTSLILRFPQLREDIMAECRPHQQP